MHIKSFLRPILVGIVVVLFAAACDKDYDELGTDIVGNDHFGFERYTGATVKTYNEKLGPIASNNLAINPLGFYENPAFGNTQANFVTQVELASVSPVFNNTDTELYQMLPAIDSVVLDIPYFSTLKTTNTDGTKVYELDSIYGTEASKFKLSVYQSNYYLRDLDPTQSLGEQQLFYTNQDADIDSYKVPVLLNNLPASDPRNADGHENSQFYFDKREHKTTAPNDDTTQPDVVTRSVPSMRLHLRADVFNTLILNTSNIDQLASNALFKNYFRGLYFKTESLGNPGNMAMINFKGGKVTMYYHEDKKTIVGTQPATYPRVAKTYVLNLSGNTVSLLNNSNENGNYLTAINNPTQEAEKLYLKGGEGSMAIVDIFGSTDVKGYTLNPNYNSNLPISASNIKYLLTNSPNGVSDEIDDIKANDWLINEANLTFVIDKDAMANTQIAEPNRIFLYDINNKKVLVDYTYDFTSNTSYPKFNKYVFGGIIEKEDVNNGRGIKYKIRITNHVRNLITKDSTNVRLGLSVTENINNVALSKRKLPVTDGIFSAPSMSVMNPLGTILYGSNPIVPDDKRLKLEIYYTKPNE